MNVHNICVYINHMQTEYIWSGKIYVQVKYMVSYKICSGKMYAQVKYMIGDGIYIQIRHTIDWDKIYLQ